MSKLTLKKIAENTLRKVGRPLSTKEIWEEANRLGTIEDFESEGKTPWATIGAYLYWSINRDHEGIFTLEGEKPRRFGLTSFKLKPVPETNYYLIGTTYEHGSIYDELKKNSVVAIGFCWENNMEYLYGKSHIEIIKDLKSRGKTSSEYSAHKKFLQLKPGDIVALKSKGWPNGKKANLEILGYAVVVEREGQVYWHNPNNPSLGHCINVEFIQTDLQITRKLGYGRTIHQITSKDHLKLIFGKYYGDNNLKNEVRERIRKRRKRKGTTKKNKGMETRSGSKPYVADLRHNRIQESFYLHLKSKYPNDRIEMEEDFIDVIRENKSEIILYEVKPYAWAEDCVREGLGQLMSYSSQITQKKSIKLIIVGPYPPNKSEKEFIIYVKGQLKIPFEYINYGQ